MCIGIPPGYFTWIMPQHFILKHPAIRHGFMITMAVFPIQKQDPAFILPYKLNDEKGYTPVHEIEKDRTSSVQMWPRFPNPGDTVLIAALVHNFKFRSKSFRFC